MKQMKTWLPDVVVVIVFALLAFAYFFPADIEGRVLNQGDISAGMGAVHEEKAYLEKTGERTRWTNALFSGMPTYQLSPSYDSTDTLTAVAKAYHLWLPDNVWYLFVYLLGFYILLRAFDFRWHLAALGSIMWAFSTYFLIIIAAGHIWKVMALAYLPPMIGGIVLAYRGKYLWGVVVTALFAALEVHANHVQMTYYYLLPILLMIVAFAIDAIRQRRWAHLLKATGAVVAGGLLGVLVNSSNLYHTWRYSKETMRGKSELVKEDSANQTSSGLERSYITDYSYGIGETWTLLVPNAKGGTSMHVLGDNEAARKEGESHAFDLGQGQRVPYSYMFNQMPQYWEESMEPGANGTMGPVYVGAFVLLLFVLGLFIVRGPMFRAVESILVIAEFCIPLLAMLTLKRIVDEPEVLTKQIKWVYTAFALTGGICLLFALMPTLFFDFTTQAEQAQFAQMLPPDQVAPFMESLSRVRQAVFTADCWRSLAVIVVGVFILLLYKARKLQTVPMVALLAVLCLVDLWSVNKRYLNDAMFKPVAERQQIRPLTDADRTILADTALDYRVLNLAGNVFNENETSYYHKSIGGYHAAKLRRYQELIEAYISQEMSQLPQLINDTQGNLSLVRGDSLFPVLNMLNTKYLLAAQQNLAVKNPWAQGNAWFIDRLDYVDNANEELDGIAKVDVRHEAVADRSFEQVLGQAAATDSTATVTLLSYEPNELKYAVESQTGGVVVFSEIYYPDWTATIDGEEAELGRVNYVLRALRVEPGRHEVVMTFRPKSIDRTETIAYVALIAMLLAVVALAVREVRRRQQQS